MYLLLYMGQSFETQFQSLTVRKYIMFFITATLLIYIVKNGISSFSKTWIKPFAIYALICFFEILYHSSTQVLYELYFPFVIISSYFVYKDLPKDALDKILYIYFLSGIALFVLFIYSFFGLMRIQGIYKSTCYYTCCMLPFYLLAKNNVVKFLGIAICLIPSILVAKRGPFIGIAAAVVAYYVLSMKESANKVRTIISAVVVLILINYALNNSDTDLLERLATMEEDQGSGRLDIFSAVFSAISNNSFFEHLFGHGVYKQYATQEDLSAHNDFIEMYWNYGLLGFVVYLSIIIKLFKFDKLYSRYKIESRPVYFASILQFVLMSLFTNMIFAPSYIASFALFWSYYNSHANKEINGLKNITI